MSRLESGRRRPTLELLLPLARAHHVPLDELAGAPASGDPRIFPRPISRRQHLAAAHPQSGRAQRVQADHPGEPEPARYMPGPQVHEGHEWLYVIFGQLRLVLGGKDFTLTAGEAAEFDTRIPHAVANGGPQPVELLNIFGPQGERVHLRARSTAPKTSTTGRSP